MRINTSKVASVDCEILLIAPFKKKNLVSSRDVYSLVSLIKVMTFQENHFQNTYGYDRFQ